MAQNVFQVDDRRGNAYTLLDVVHVTGTASTFTVDQSAVSAAHSPSNGQTAINIESTPSSGVSLATSVALSATRVGTIASGVASGTYTIVVRHVGSAAGIGSYKAGL